MRLADSFIPFLSYGVTLRQTAGQTQPAYEAVRSEVLRLLKDSEDACAKGICSPDEYNQARYAVCAWMDETVQASPWNHKARWRPELLQRVYYQSSDAGEKFFERLGRLGVQENGVREVYFLCLTLGFEGRYGLDEKGAQALDQLKAQHLKLLFESTGEVPSLATLENGGLFPSASLAAPAKASDKTSFRGRLWVAGAVAAGSTVILITLFLIYRYSLMTIGDNVLKAVNSR